MNSTGYVMHSVPSSISVAWASVMSRIYVLGIEE